MNERSVADVRRPLPAPLGLLPESWPLPAWLRGLIGRVSGISGVEIVAGCLDFEASPGEFARQALVRLGVTYDLAGAELEHVPESGGVIIIANHPFGGVDGLIAINALYARRPDLKLLANGVLARLKPLQSAVLPVDMFGSDARQNAQSVREALRHVADGGALFTFPAGEVAHLQWGSPPSVDPAWTAVHRRASFSWRPLRWCPMYMEGRNSTLFQLLGLLHPLSSHPVVAARTTQQVRPRGPGADRRAGQCEAHCQARCARRPGRAPARQRAAAGAGAAARIAA